MVVFAQRHPEKWALVSVDTAGGSPRSLTDGRSRDWQPSWSPDGEELAFTSDRDGNWEIYVLRPDEASSARPVTRDPGSDMSPAWSPSGSWILFLSDRSGNDELFVVAPAGGEPRRLTTSAEDETEAVWSHDGARIAYVRDRGGSHELRVLTLESGEDVLLDSAPILASPSWFPKGDALAYSAKGGSGTWQVLRAVVSTRERNRLTDGVRDVNPALSPDGKLLAFTRAAAGNQQLFVKDLADGRDLQLTREPPAGGDAEAQIDRPAWSPDSSRIALTIGSSHGISGPNALCILNVRAGEPVIVAEGDECADPAWRPGSSRQR